MRLVVFLCLSLTLMGCGRPGPAAETSSAESASTTSDSQKYLGTWENGSLRLTISENDGVYLLRNVGPDAGVLTGIQVLPLTYEEGQMKTNTYMGNVVVAGDELFFGGVAPFHRAKN